MLTTLAKRRKRTASVYKVPAANLVWNGAMRLETAYENNDSVDEITDHAGIGNAVQSSGPSQGVYKDDQQNGQPGLLFDGGDRYPHTGTHTLGTSWTYIGVWIPQSSAAGGFVGINTYTRAYAGLWGPGLTYNRTGSWYTSSGTVTYNQANIITLRQDGSTYYWRINGVALGPVQKRAVSAT